MFLKKLQIKKIYLINNIIDKTFQQFPSLRRIQLHKEYGLQVKSINHNYKDSVIGHKFIITLMMSS